MIYCMNCERIIFACGMLKFTPYNVFEVSNMLYNVYITVNLPHGKIVEFALFVAYCIYVRSDAINRRRLCSENRVRMWIFRAKETDNYSTRLLYAYYSLLKKMVSHFLATICANKLIFQYLRPKWLIHTTRSTRRKWICADSEYGRIQTVELIY